MENMQISLTLTVAQVNFIMAALGQRPYSEVSELIALIRSQGEAAIQQVSSTDSNQTPVDTPE
mgnify:FL=1